MSAQLEFILKPVQWLMATIITTTYDLEDLEECRWQEVSWLSRKLEFFFKNKQTLGARNSAFLGCNATILE